MGPGGAGIALGVLAFGHFQEQGLDAIVPSTLSMALAMLAWTVILVEKPGRDRWVPVLVAATVAMHSGGLLWSAIIVSFFVLFRFERSGHFYRVGSSCIAAWLVGAAYVMYLPDAVVGAGRFYGPFSRDPDVMVELGKNVATAGRVAGAWVLSFCGGAEQLAQRLSMPTVVVIGACLSLLLIGLCFLGWRSLEQRRRRGVVLLGVLVVGVTAGTVLYVIPGYPAPLFVRSWVFLAVLMAGLAGQGIWVLARHLIAMQAQRFVLAAAISTVVIIAALPRVVWGVESLGVLRESMASRNDLIFDASQPRLLEQQAPRGSAVLYLGENPLYFFLTHGGNRFGAVYYPAVARTPEEGRWIQSNTALRFVVGMNPAAGLALGRGDTLTVAGGPAGARTRLMLLGPSRGPVVLAYWPGEDRTLVIRRLVNLDRASWVTVPAWPSLTLQVEGAPSERVRVGGLKYGERDALNWPWGTATELSVTRAGGTALGAIGFNLDRAIPILHGDADLLSDQGDMFLARILPRNDSLGSKGGD